MEEYKEVMFPILVPIGNYCKGNNKICSYLNNGNGIPECKLEFYPLKKDKENRILKPEECKLLKEV